MQLCYLMLILNLTTFCIVILNHFWDNLNDIRDDYRESISLFLQRINGLRKNPQSNPHKNILSRNVEHKTQRLGEIQRIGWQCKTPSQSPAGAVYLVRSVLKRRFVNVRWTRRRTRYPGGGGRLVDLRLLKKPITTITLAMRGYP